LYAVDDTYGGRQLASVAERYAALIAETMGRCSYGPNVEKALYRVRGELHACAGWFAFDSSDHPRAERNFAEGLRDALLAADGMLQARIWSYMARQSWELGRATETVTIARAALNVTRTGRDPRLSALLHGRMALGYAAAGEGARCGRSLAQADTHLDRADDTPAAWLAFVGPGELLGSAAMAHMLLGRPDHAVRHEEHGLSLLAPQFRRNRFAKLVHLSECHLAARRPDQAVHVAEQALDLYPSVDCPRWAHHLRRFRDSLTTGATTTTTAFVERHDALTAPRAETPGPWTRQH
jgi:tetratricopeptide (TPR) repeat protein